MKSNVKKLQVIAPVLCLDFLTKFSGVVHSDCSQRKRGLFSSGTVLDWLILDWDNHFQNTRYRSYQYYESKKLHNAYVTLFSMSHDSSKTYHFDKETVNESRSPIAFVTFGFKAKIGRLCSPKSLFKFPLK